MAYIELVIKLPEEMYKWVYDVNKFYDDYGIGDFIDLIMNGTPLPIRHGKIIDVNDLLEYIGLDDNDYNRDENVGEIITLEDIDRIPTIIEADKE